MLSAPKCDPTPPPAPVRSCPYIGWQRTVVAGEEDIDWEVETPGHIGIGDVSITKRVCCARTYATFRFSSALV